MGSGKTFEKKVWTKEKTQTVAGAKKIKAKRES